MLELKNIVCTIIMALLTAVVALSAMVGIWWGVLLLFT